EHSKIFETTDFYYRTITVERPLRLNYAYTTDRIERVMAARAIARLDEHTQATLRHVLQQAQQDHDEVVFTQRQVFGHDLTARLDQAGVVLTPAVLRTVLAELGEHDDHGELVT